MDKGNFEAKLAVILHEFDPARDERVLEFKAILGDSDWEFYADRSRREMEPVVRLGLLGRFAYDTAHEWGGTDITLDTFEGGFRTLMEDTYYGGGVDREIVLREYDRMEAIEQRVGFSKQEANRMHEMFMGLVTAAGERAWGKLDKELREMAPA